MSTIAAIATPPGSGGIGVIRVSGPEAKNILASLFSPFSSSFEDFIPRHMHHGAIKDRNGEALDDALVVFMPGPRSFTGEDIAEIHCHGGQTVTHAILETVLRLGARQAERGEFTRRAFLNGRLDLSQAEAVAELIASPGRQALRYSLNRLAGYLAQKVTDLTQRLDELRAHACVAVDFPDDEVPSLPVEDFIDRTREIRADIDILLENGRRASICQHGKVVTMAGAVNAGKSSLLNALAGKRRALVSATPGTTRDFLEENLDFSGMPVRLVDTAGLRDNFGDELEADGANLGMEMIRQADLVWLVLDASLPCEKPDSAMQKILDSAAAPILLVWNKCDIRVPEKIPHWLENMPFCQVSALTGNNLDCLVQKTCAILMDDKTVDDNGLAPNARQTLALEEALEELRGFEQDLAEGQMFDLCLARLDSASAALGTILGLAAHDQLLDKIFSQFCIGK